MGRRRRVLVHSLAAAIALASASVAVPTATASSHHGVVTHGMLVRGAKPRTSGPGNLLTYHGGAVGLLPQVVIVYWGSQWAPPDQTSVTNDAAGAAKLQLDFLHAIATTTWVNSVKQYCAGTGPKSVGASSGSTTCSNPIKSLPTDLVADTWLDNATAAPSAPTQADLAAEAVRAAQHEAALGRNASGLQYVIDTASGNNAVGFGTSYCAWHGSTPYGAGQIAYTNMPYLPDAGGACGASYIPATGDVDPALEGVTIVAGHEWAETLTDEYPNTGWLDLSGAENADKCAWLSYGPGAVTTITAGGHSYVVQSLWSNAANGCVNAS